MTTKIRKYDRILLKLSGEALAGSAEYGIDPKVLDRMAVEIGQLVEIGIQVGLVVGGGNLFRGAALHEAGMDRVTGDHMGMLATVMNALAMRDALERAGITTRVMSAIPMSGMVEHYDRRNAMRHLRDGDVVIFAAGTGNPFFTTDSAACLRVRPCDMPPIIVAADRDTPGIMLIHCVSPMMNALGKVSTISFFGFNSLSINTRTTPPSSRLTATVVGLSSSSSMRSFNNKPRTAEGMNAKMSLK